MKTTSIEKTILYPDNTDFSLAESLYRAFRTDPEDRIGYRAVMQPDGENTGLYTIRIFSSADPSIQNPYTAEELFLSLQSAFLCSPDKHYVYVNPPLDFYIRTHVPLFESIIRRVAPSYDPLQYTHDEFLSELYLSVYDLYQHNYCITKTVVEQAFRNRLRHIVRERRAELKEHTLSIYQQVSSDDTEDVPLLLIDVLSEESGEDEENDKELCDKVRRAIIEEVGVEEYEKIMRQLTTKTVDRRTSYILGKLRKEFAPDYIPRPNSRGKKRNNGGKKNV